MTDAVDAPCPLGQSPEPCLMQGVLSEPQSVTGTQLSTNTGTTKSLHTHTFQVEHDARHSWLATSVVEDSTPTSSAQAAPEHMGLRRSPMPQSTTSAASPTSTSSSSGSGGLSKNTKLEIGMCVGFGGLMALAIVWKIYQKSKAKRAVAAKAEDMPMQGRAHDKRPVHAVSSY